MRQIFVCSPPRKKEARVFVQSSGENQAGDCPCHRLSKWYCARLYWAFFLHLSRPAQSVSEDVLLHRLLRVFDRGLGEKPCRELSRLVVRPDFRFFSFGIE